MQARQHLWLQAWPASYIRPRGASVAVTSHAGTWPRTVNLDGHEASHLAMRWLAKEDVRWQAVTVRDRRYLNNIVEQDHRAIKRRCASMWGLKSFRTATVTVAGIESAHGIHKRQYSVFLGGDATIPRSSSSGIE